MFFIQFDFFILHFPKGIYLGNISFQTVPLYKKNAYCGRDFSDLFVISARLGVVQKKGTGFRCHLAARPENQDGVGGILCKVQLTAARYSRCYKSTRIHASSGLLILSEIA